MLVLGELALRLRADSKGGRIGTETVRKIPLELLELPKEAVVLGVRNGRTVENVVLVGRVVQQDTQLRGSVMFLLRRPPRRLWLVAGSLECLPLLLLWFP